MLEDVNLNDPKNKHNNHELGEKFEVMVEKNS